MIHELLTISHNTVDLKHLAHLEAEMKQVLLGAEDDTFFKEIMFENFGEVAEAIHKLVQDFLKSKSSHAQFQSIDDM